MSDSQPDPVPEPRLSGVSGDERLTATSLLPIRIFVGSDERQGAAEAVLERSVLEHASRPVELTWMRAGDPGWGDEWNRGRPRGQMKSGRGWGTEFSLFRFAVPELCGFEGRAIYLDSDMVVLGDVAELWEAPAMKGHGVLSTSMSLLDVLVFDCEYFARPDWPRIKDLRKMGVPLNRLRARLHEMGTIAATLPKAWDCRDEAPPGAKLVHFTRLPTQPWRPWPEKFRYTEHPNKGARAVWDRYAVAR